MTPARKLTAKAAAKLEAKRVREAALIMTAQVPNQATLDHVLLQEPDRERRLKIYEFMKPALRFMNPKFPETIITA